MSLLSPERQAEILLYRQKAAEGTLTLDEMRRAVAMLREGRVGASAASDASRAKRAKATVKTADELLGELKL